METFSIEVNHDDYSIVQLIKNKLNIPESKAATVIMEVGLLNFINPISSNLKGIEHNFDQKYGDGKFKELTSELSGIWHQ